MGDVLNIIKIRHSTRRFATGMGVEQDLIKKIIEAGVLAPTACNKQR